MSDFMSGAYSSYFDTAISNAKNNTASNAAKSGLNKLSKDSTEEELRDAVKSFEAYFAEQVIKQVKESMTLEDKDNSTMGQYKDLMMDSAISEMANYLVEQVGGDLTEDLVKQMKLNYGIE